MRLDTVLTRVVIVEWKWHLGQNLKEMKHERKREWTWEQTVIMFSLRFFFSAFNISRSFNRLEETHFLDSSLPLTAFPSLDLRIQTKYLLRGTLSASEVTEPLLVGGGLCAMWWRPSFSLWPLPLGALAVALLFSSLPFSLACWAHVYLAPGASYCVHGCGRPGQCNMASPTSSSSQWSHHISKLWPRQTF